MNLKKLTVSFIKNSINFKCRFSVSAKVIGLFAVMLPEVMVMRNSYLLHFISLEEERGLAGSGGLILLQPDKDKFSPPPFQQ